MRHRTRDLDQTLDPTQALCKRVDLGRLAEPARSLLAARDAEAQHAAAHGVAVLLLRDGVLRVRREAGVVYEEDVGGSGEGSGDGGGVLGGLAGAQVQGLHAAVGEPAVEGGGDGADGVLEEGEALVELWGVEGGGAHDDVRVAVDVLCDGVDDDVCAVVEGVLDVGGEEGVVDDDEDAVLVGDCGDGADVDEGEGGVGGGLDPDELCVGLDQGLDVDLEGGREGDVDVVGGGHLCEVAVGSAVDIGHGDDVGAGREGLEDVGGGGGARGEGEGVAGVLESRDRLFEVVAVGVGRAGVLVLAYGLSDGGLGEGCGERNLQWG